MPYKIIYKATSDKTEQHQTKWEVGCPLLIKAFQVSRDTVTGDTFFQMRLKNITADTIDSFVAKARFYAQDGTLESHEIHPLDADIPAGKDYVISPIQLDNSVITEIDVKIVSTSSKSSAWKSTNDPKPIPAPQSSSICKDALNERKALLSEKSLSKAAASEKDPLYEDSYWVCACGQLNGNSRDTCCECNANRKVLDSVFGKSEADLLKLKEQRDENQKVEQQKKKKRLKLLAFISAAICVAVVAGFFIYAKVIVPSQPLPAFLGYKVGDTIGDDFKKEFEYTKLGSDYAEGFYSRYEAIKPTEINGLKGYLCCNVKDNEIIGIYWSASSYWFNKYTMKSNTQTILDEMERRYGKGEDVVVPNSGETKLDILGPRRTEYDAVQFVPSPNLVYIVCAIESSGDGVAVVECSSSF